MRLVNDNQRTMDGKQIAERKLGCARVCPFFDEFQILNASRQIYKMRFKIFVMGIDFAPIGIFHTQAGKCSNDNTGAVT